MPAIYSIEDLRNTAKRRLPRIAFDMVDGGSGEESALRRNLESVTRIELLPRVLSSSDTRCLEITLLGRRYSAPFGIAPMGLANIASPGTDLGLAAAANMSRIPYVLSTAASTSIEDLIRQAPDLWFQLYVGSDRAISDDLVARVDAAGVQVLVVTVDVPMPGRRIRDLRNGFALPLRPSLGLLLDLLAHPAWSLQTLRRGAPRLANMQKYAPAGASAQTLAQLMASQCSASFNWLELEKLRARWPRHLVVKGILDARDAVQAQKLGVDAIVVSNHGGRQLDCAPVPIDALPAIRAAVADQMPLLIDGGFRTGEDIAKALVLGADFVFFGRPFLYAVAAFGATRGGPWLIGHLRQELDRALALLGVLDLKDLARIEGHRYESVVIADGGGHVARD